MQFSKIINQREVKQQLVELIQHNRLSHALLFLSKEGSGALSLALALAQYLTCESANPKKQNPNSNASLFGKEPISPNSKPQTIPYFRNLKITVWQVYRNYRISPAR